MVGCGRPWWSRWQGRQDTGGRRRNLSPTQNLQWLAAGAPAIQLFSQPVATMVAGKASEVPGEASSPHHLHPWCMLYFVFSSLSIPAHHPYSTPSLFPPWGRLGWGGDSSGTDPTSRTAWSQESGVRSQESGVRSQESGVRSQESGVLPQIISVAKCESILDVKFVSHLDIRLRSKLIYFLDFFHKKILNKYV